jgi:hypothetical protein
MTDGRDFGWQPQQGNSEQNGQDQPGQGNRYDTGTHRQRISALHPSLRLPAGTNWFQPGSGRPYPPPYPPPDPPSQPPPDGPPGGPQDRKPWAARHRVLTGILVCCGLVSVVGVAAAAGSSSSSSRSAAMANSPTVKAPAATASPSVKKAPVAAPAVTTPSFALAPATPALPSTQPRTTAAVHKSAPSTPARTTAAAPSPTPSKTPSPTASKTPASCSPLTSAGKCYEPGEFCRVSDHGISGVAGDGEAIKCEDNGGWLWEPV